MNADDFARRFLEAQCLQMELRVQFEELRRRAVREVILSRTLQEESRRAREARRRPVSHEAPR